jgi:hypothetical protein
MRDVDITRAVALPTVLLQTALPTCHRSRPPERARTQPFQRFGPEHRCAQRCVVSTAVRCDRRIVVDWPLVAGQGSGERFQLHAAGRLNESVDTAA